MTDKPIRVRQSHSNLGNPVYAVFVACELFTACTGPHLNYQLRRAWAHAQWHMGLTETRGVE